MATIGLDKLYYAKITEGANGDETYAAPVSLAKAMSAELKIDINEATLYADDGAAEVVKEFKSGTLTLGIDNIGAAGRKRSDRFADRRQQGACISERERRSAGRARVPRKEEQRQVSLLLALTCCVRHTCNKSADEGR